MSGIIRVEKNKNYSVVSNVPANNKELSWEARGVLYYLLTKPDGWECRNQDLINKGPAGGDKVERIMDELQEHGYITRKRYQKEDGLFDWVTTIHEMPVTPEETVKERIAKKRANALEKNRRRAERRKALTIGVLSTDGSPTNGLHPDIVITEEVINNNYMGASAKNELDDYFEPKTPIEPIPLKKPIADRIKEKDPELLMSALGVTAISRAAPGMLAIEQSGWQIGNDTIRELAAHFLDLTGYSVPAIPERGKWVKTISEQLKEFPAADLPNLYREAWTEYKPQVLAGNVDISHPGALTGKIRMLNRRKELANQTTQATATQLTPEQIARYKQLQEQFTQ